MKHIVYITFLLFVLASINIQGEGVPVLNYKIISDTVSGSVPEGKCLVYGVVTMENESIEGCKVSTEDHELYGVSSSKGEYQFLMDAKEIRIYAFEPGFNEVVTEKINFKSGHSVHIDFYMSENIQVEINLKPVIYAYNKEEIEAKIEMKLVGELTFSYPIYNDGWDILVKENGIALENNETKVYPYLFWEGETPGLDFQTTNSNFGGFQIKTDSTISFLENQCENIGLNQNETADFITFWGPRIQRYNYAKVEFLIDEQYDAIGEIIVTPKPDNMRRVYILFQGEDEYDANVLSNPSKIAPISREGFTVIEWGGTELPPRKRLNP